MNGHHRFAALSLWLFLLWIPLSAAEPDAATRYAEKAIALLEDGISRQTVHGEGNVPAYAESLRAIFLAGGFPPESINIIPYGETASLIVRYAGDGSSGRQPILLSSHMTSCPLKPMTGCVTLLNFRRMTPFFTGGVCSITSLMSLF